MESSPRNKKEVKLMVSYDVGNTSWFSNRLPSVNPPSCFLCILSPSIVFFNLINKGFSLYGTLGKRGILVLRALSFLLVGGDLETRMETRDKSFEGSGNESGLTLVLQGTSVCLNECVKCARYVLKTRCVTLHKQKTQI